MFGPRLALHHDPRSRREAARPAPRPVGCPVASYAVQRRQRLRPHLRLALRVGPQRPLARQLHLAHALLQHAGVPAARRLAHRLGASPEPLLRPLHQAVDDVLGARLAHLVRRLERQQQHAAHDRIEDDGRHDQHAVLPVECVEQQTTDWREDEAADTGSAHRDAGRQGTPPLEVVADGHDGRQVDEPEPEP